MLLLSACQQAIGREHYTACAGVVVGNAESNGSISSGDGGGESGGIEMAE